MPAPADIKSTKADIIHKGGQRQRSDAEAFGERLRSALAEKALKASTLADQSGVSRQLISEYAAGKKVAGADNLFSIADCLGVQARWLLRGEGERYRSGRETSPTEQLLPKLDLFRFSELGKPEPTEMIAIPSILMPKGKGSADLWLVEMPNDAMPSLAREGELLICRDPDEIIQDRRVYVLLIDGRPIVRRAIVRPEGLQLRGEDEAATILVTANDLERITPIGRVVSAISIHSA